MTCIIKTITNVRRVTIVLNHKILPESKENDFMGMSYKKMYHIKYDLYVKRRAWLQMSEFNAGVS